MDCGSCDDDIGCEKVTIEEMYKASKTRTITMIQKESWPVSILPACLRAMEEWCSGDSNTSTEEYLIMCFRTMRNMCTLGEDVQGRFSSFSKDIDVIVCIFERKLWERNQSAQLSSSPSSTTTSSTTPSSSPSSSASGEEIDPQGIDIDKVLKPALQFLANLIVGNEHSQEMVWGILLDHQGVLSHALRNADHTLTHVASMLVYTCCKNNAKCFTNLREHHATHIVQDMLLIMERFDNESADTDFSIFFAEHLLQSKEFGVFMTNLPTKSSPPPPPPLSHVPPTLDGEVEMQKDKQEDNGKQMDEPTKATKGDDALAEHVHHLKKPSLEESGRGVQAKTALLKFIDARLSAGRVELSVDGQRVTDEAIGVCDDKLNLSTHVTTYLSQKFQELAFLADDVEWWHDASQHSAAIHFMLITRSLGSIAKFGSNHLREHIGQGGLLEACVTLLSNAQGWIKRATPPSEKKKKAEKGGDDDASFPVQAKGAACELVRLVANICFRCKKNQDLFRELEGFPHVLERFLHDDNNPFIREWSIVAVRNLCEGNKENQDYIKGTESVPRDIVNKEEVRDMYSVDVEMDEKTGRLKVKRFQRK
eukprot:m.226030 g.226030  ORF g.226030 m.226030 type:complete len:593 (-) comp13863_c4_seq2:114-1892(-)